MGTEDDELVREGIADYQRRIDAYRTQWVAKGGRAEELEAVLAIRPSFMRMELEGPSGYGPLPERCTLIGDLREARNRHRGFEERRRRRLEPFARRVAAREAEIGIEHTRGSQFIPAVRSLWGLEAVRDKASHSFWNDDRGPILSFDLDDYLTYAWAKAIGAGADAVFETCLAALANGHFPVDLERDRVAVFSAAADRLARAAKGR